MGMLGCPHKPQLLWLLMQLLLQLHLTGYCVNSSNRYNNSYSKQTYSTLIPTNFIPIFYFFIIILVYFRTILIVLRKRS